METQQELGTFYHCFFWLLLTKLPLSPQTPLAPKYPTSSKQYTLKIQQMTAKMSVKNRTNVALAGKPVILQLEVTIPVNGSKSRIKCYHDGHQVWEHVTNQNTSPNPIKKSLSANISMANRSCSGEYYFEYMDEKHYWVVLVRDVGYLQETGSSFTPLLVVFIVLLLSSLTGSIFILKWYKAHSPSEGKEDHEKVKKGKRNTVTTEEGATSDSVYTELEKRTVSVYDVLKVDEVRKASTKSESSKKKAKSAPVEEGILESVYENF
ncbi:hypothetical protein C0J50_21988 [Silurus asotus]|uniref:Uncharacterized protein n=1 Tax=Silurus asotus TaxID=30991 RepID=A0AAD5FIM9_SILAS|nr:hypothetical protein C0J50_21988 [Silurus asotus]